MSPQQQQQQVSEAALLCQSCDRCRARKTRCDGQRPCLGCVTKYRKAHNLGNSSIEELPQEVFDCVYSPAKRRGPVPGRAQTRKHKHLPVGHASDGFNNENATRRSSWVANTSTTHEQDVLSDPAMDGVEPPATRRVRTSSATTSLPKAPDTLTAHLHLLEPTSVQGNRLRAYFRLGVDEILCLAPIPTNDEFARQLGNETITTTATTLTPCQRHVLWAGRLGEVALGALVHNQVPLALELCNAAVHCLRECSRSEIQNVDATTTSTTTSTSTSSSSNAMGWELARAYFWLGTFRAFRGDMERYFKYRRVCLTHLSKSEDPKHELLLAAISFLDSWAYMVYNANEKELPDIDMPVVPVANNNNNNNKNNFGCMDPSNQMWIQGAPPVYLNNEAPLPARSLDALACAVRQCCDQANNRFAEIHKEVNSSSTDSNETMQDTIPQNSIVTPTRRAVLANTDELCSRNMVLSAFALLQQHEASTSAPEKNQGHHLIISAMDAFLENGDEDGSGGFTDSQIQSLLSVCNIVIENPYLLFHAGPTYHMVSNSAVLICHLLNGMYATQYGSESHPNPEMETAVFDEILDTFLAVRKLLNIHRRKLPVKLRCHGIPRPNFLSSPTPTTNSSNGSNEDVPFIDLGNTLMCACRGCQGFVLMACSPCVAAERAQAAARKQELELTQETLDMEELYDFGNEFDLDDDELLNMLSRMIPT